MRRRRGIQSAFLVACVAALATQAWACELHAQQPPARPGLDAAADTNDWRAYYERGVRAVRLRPDIADAAFFWASRLDPTRPEPLYGRFVAFWCRGLLPFDEYLFEDLDVRRDPRAIAADSLAMLAYERSPFFNRGLIFAAFARNGLQFGASEYFAGWKSWGDGDVRHAADMFGRAVAHDPDKLAWARFDRATAFVRLGDIDSAAVELERLMATLERQHATKLVIAYESKQIVDYGLGLLYLARADTARAIVAFEQALVESLAFAPAHAALGDIAIARHDTAGAIGELQLAVELAPNDAVVHLRYGYALSAARRAADAEREFRLAVKLEPWFADAHFALGALLDVRGSRGEAMTEYQAFATRAPRSAGQLVARAQTRIAELAETTSPAARSP